MVSIAHQDTQEKYIQSCFQNAPDKFDALAKFDCNHQFREGKIVDEDNNLITMKNFAKSNGIWLYLE